MEEFATTTDERLMKKAEEAAVAFLEKNGYGIQKRNFACPAGEAQIVATIDDNVVFCSVTVSADIDAGFVREDRSPERREKLEVIAAYYLRDSGLCDVRFRFDEIALLVLTDNSAGLRHHINAFSGE